MPSDAPALVRELLVRAQALTWLPWCAVVLAWAVGIATALEGIARLVQALGGFCAGGRPHIRDSAQPLAKLDLFWDIAFSWVNKAMTAAFVWHALLYATDGRSGVRWMVSMPSYSIVDALAVGRSVLEILALFFVYDAYYYWLHRVLHVPALYGLVHKHHHRQRSPFRGNADAINVHPLEFALGEYLHLAAAVTLRVVGLAIGAGGGGSVHALSLLAFVLLGGVFASLNHTREDVRLGELWQVRFHDIHHARNIRANYSQYSAVWDRLFGTFQAYGEVLDVSSKAA